MNLPSAPPPSPRPFVKPLLQFAVALMVVYAVVKGRFAFQDHPGTVARMGAIVKSAITHQPLPAAVTNETARAVEGKVRAPDFPEGLEWLNTPTPLHIRDLRGKIVLLDFWTYCCINCMHVIPDLKKFETEFADSLVVIGVHTPKFQNEQSTAQIGDAVQRYEITHPVVNDVHREVWNRYVVQAWPTLVLIDPRGMVVAAGSGEGLYDDVRKLIAQLIATYDANGELRHGTVTVAATPSVVPPIREFSYPGKVAVDAARKELIVSDSNHNQIRMLSLASGALRETIGSGERGANDGDYAHAQFQHPQGVAVDGDLLYVADTENHLLRVINRAAKTVTTIAGTGAQAMQRERGGNAREVALNSPWDLWVDATHRVVIAMAGAHQIWRFDPQTSQISPLAGSGREAIVDGDGVKAAFAQPSGLASDGKNLFIADSEVSALRNITLDDTTHVATLIGEGLFAFGDMDGEQSIARMQHPLGVAYLNGVVYVADTYNHKIKRYTLATHKLETLAGTGEPGLRDGPALQAEFNEPGGLAAFDNTLYIADTNNHAIRVLDLASMQVRTLPETK